MNDSSLLSEGGFGCVYHPSIGCLSSAKTKQSLSHRNKFVSKIQHQDDTTKNEIYIGTIVRQIKQYKMYFAPIVKQCKPITLSQLKGDEFKECTLLAKKKGASYIITESRFVDNLTFFKYMIASDNNKELILNIMSTYTHLITALNRLHQQHIVHYDLKGENIVYDTKRTVPIIIDFGLSIPLHKITKQSLGAYFYVYAPDYYVWAPEIHFLCFLLNDNSSPSKNEIKEISKTIVSNNISLRYLYSPDFLVQYTENLQRYLLTFHGKTPHEVFQMIQPYSNTWDNFSVSMIYMRILYYLNIEGFTKNEFIIYFSKLLLQNAHPNPKRRLTPTQTILLFNKYFYKSGVNAERDYKELLYSLGKNKSVIGSLITMDESKLNSIITR